ncbi:MAG: hypothetical protein EBR09_02210 [Proteobacteria bacterium]|nr:hypothetical protein [Pseudomonadota bacterium]
MTAPKVVRKVLLAAKNNSNTNFYLRCLKAAEFEVEVAENLLLVPEMLANGNFVALVHSLQGFERAETSVFHHRLCRAPESLELLRFLVYRTKNMRAVAFSLDLGMPKALDQEQAIHSIGHLVNMSHQAYLARDTLQRQGLNLAVSGKTNLAPEEMQVIEKVYKAFPNDLMIRTAQARVSFLKKDYQLAVELCKRILQNEPYAVRAMTILGEVEAALGHHELGLKLILKAHEFAAGNPDRLAVLGQIYVDLGQYSEGKKYVLEGMRLYPKMRVLWDRLHKVPLNGPETFEMLNLVKPELSPEEFVLFAVALTKPLILLRQFDFVSDAISASLAQLDSNTEKAAYLYYVALELREMGAKSDALLQLKRCLEFDPRFPGAGDLLLKMKANLVA